jgi:ferredoxin
LKEREERRFNHARSNLAALSTSLITRSLTPTRPVLSSPLLFLPTSSISVTYKDEKDNSVTTVRVPLGVSLLEAAHRNDVDLEGACEGSLACSTCHIILEDRALYALLPEPDDDENDMLDLAYGLTETSRLGCQVKAAKELDGLSVVIPAATRNFAVDGHIPKPH